VINRTLPNQTRDLRFYDKLGRTTAILRQEYQSWGWHHGWDFFNDFYGFEVPWGIQIPHLKRNLDRTREQFEKRMEKSRWQTQNKLVYAYDAAGNVSAQYKNNRPTFYEYDANDRLTKAAEPFGLWNRYAYDAVGNMTEKQV